MDDPEYGKNEGEDKCRYGLCDGSGRYWLGGDSDVVVCPCAMPDGSEDYDINDDR